MLVLLVIATKRLISTKSSIRLDWHQRLTIPWNFMWNPSAQKHKALDVYCPLESVGIICLISCVSAAKQKSAFKMQSHKASALKTKCLETWSQNNFVLFKSMPRIIHTLTQAYKEFKSLFDIHKPINVAILYFYAGRQFSPRTLCFLINNKL